MDLTQGDRIEWIDFEGIPQEGVVVVVAPMRALDPELEVWFDGFIAHCRDDETPTRWGYLTQVCEVNGAVVF